MKVMPVEASASISAPRPKAAVPPSVLHACLRFTKKPHMMSEEVNKRESVALQTFCTALASDVSLPSFESSLRGTSCITAATTARGPSRTNIRRFSRLEGNRRVRNWMWVIYE